MGLDMSLKARKYVSGWTYKGADPRDEYDKLVEMYGMKDFVTDDSPSAYVEFTVAYWRKANQIHQWFVDNVQDSEDNCMPYYVEREKLEELRSLCLRVLGSTTLVEGTVHTGTVWNAEHPQGAVQLAPGKILSDPRVAHDLLPTQSGFFFGGTDYDEGYWYDLTETVRQIDKVLDLPGGWELEYRASW